MGITVELVKLNPLNQDSEENMRNIVRISNKLYIYEAILDNGDSRGTANRLSQICQETNCEGNNRIVILNRKGFCKVIPEFLDFTGDWDFSIEEDIITPLLEYSDDFFEKSYSNNLSYKEIAKLRFERLSKLANIFEVKFPFSSIKKLEKLITEAETVTDEDFDNGFTNEYIKFEEFIDELLEDKESLEKALLNLTKDKYKEEYALFWEE